MKVGDYVRTKNKGIFKIDERCYFNKDFKEFWFKAPCDYGNEWTTTREVIKSSPNIIDLIEEHDVIVVKERSGDLSKYEVEEYEIVDIYSMKTRIKSLGIFIDNHYKSLQDVEQIIKSIVTHEQFSQMEYKVGD